MKADIISIGDELLIGQVINSNASFIATEMIKAGYDIHRILTIGDVENEIKDTLTDCLKNVDVVLITGGIGPTKDDKTKHVLCQYFNDKLELNEQAYENLKSVLNRRGIQDISETNYHQAELPSQCICLNNPLGTACGMAFIKDMKIVVSMPGVPYEMESLMRHEVIPFIKKQHGQHNTIIHQTIMVYGITEAKLSDLLTDFESQLPAHISLAYLPNHGIIRLRLTAKGNDFQLSEDLKHEISKLTTIVKDFLINTEDEPYEMIIGKLLKAKKSMVAVAESCTGGYVSHLLTKQPGSSAFFKGGLIAYQNEVKSEILQVRKDVLKKYGAVSELVVKNMALNTMQMFDSEYTIAISGIAGPDGGSEEKPVGTVWIAVASPTHVSTKLLQASGPRQVIIVRAAYAALNLLQNEILRK